MEWVHGIARDLFMTRDPEILSKTDAVVRGGYEVIHCVIGMAPSFNRLAFPYSVGR